MIFFRNNWAKLIAARVTAKVGCIIILGLFIPIANAHTTMGNASFFDGIIHPWSGLDHLFVAMAVGAWGILQRQKQYQWLPVMFLISLLAGLLLPVVTNVWFIAELIAVASVVICLILLSQPSQFSFRASVLLTVIFGIIHGHIHATQMLTLTNQQIVGVVLSTAVILMLSWQITRLTYRMKCQRQWRMGFAFIGLSCLVMSLAR